MVYFQTKNSNLGKFCWACKWKMLEYFMANYYILWPFGIFYGHLVIWYIFQSFGILYREKSGNPARNLLPRIEFFFLATERKIGVTAAPLKQTFKKKILMLSRRGVAVTASTFGVDDCGFESPRWGVRRWKLCYAVDLRTLFAVLLLSKN
jgi:hypothetical protein